MKVSLMGLVGAAAALAAPLAAATPDVGAPAAAEAPFGPASAVAATDLAKVTGRADTAMEIRANNTSTVSNNSVIGQSQTGTINFDAASFANLNGLSLLSANTGNNVSINSSLNLNVSIQR